MSEFGEPGLWQVAFSNAFWVFLGIVAGALVQYGLQFLLSKRQRKQAKKILEIEIMHNVAQVKPLKTRFEDYRARSDNIGADEIFVDMRLFNYRRTDTLLNHGYFHSSLSTDKFAQYFDFMTKFNTDFANNLYAALIQNLETENRAQFARLCSSVVEECAAAESNLRGMLSSMK